MGDEMTSYDVMNRHGRQKIILTCRAHSFYHGGGMSLLVRPRVNLQQQKGTDSGKVQL